MSDERERRLERTSWCAEGADAQVAHLWARVRAGKLTLDRVAQAARFGHRAAGRVVGHDCAEDWSLCLRCMPTSAALEELVAADPAGKVGWLAPRAAIAAGRAILAEWDALHAAGGVEALSARAWRIERPRGGLLVHPTWAPLRHAIVHYLEAAEGLVVGSRAAAVLAEGLARGRGAPPAAREREPGPRAGVGVSGAHVVRPHPGFDLRWTARPLRLARAVRHRRRGFPAADLGYVRRARDVAGVIAAVGAEVGAWLVGDDPVAVRVASRADLAELGG